MKIRILAAMLALFMAPALIQAQPASAATGAATRTVAAAPADGVPYAGSNRSNRSHRSLYRKYKSACGCTEKEFNRLLKKKKFRAQLVRSVLWGLRGLKGKRGKRGLRGLLGRDGVEGLEGLIGREGLAGLLGERGLTGLLGEKGVEGLKGKDGLNGDKGATGARGPAGPAGTAGPKGDKGDVGISGYEVVYKEESVPAGANGDVRVPCPAGKKVLGGGVDFASNDIVLRTSMPLDGWRGFGRNTSTTNAALLKVWAICANVS